MKEIQNFGLLLSDIPCGRAYIQTFLRKQLRPREVIILQFRTGKKTSMLKRAYKALPQMLQLLPFRSLMKKIELPIEFDPFESIHSTLKRLNIKAETLVVSSINDPQVVEKIRQMKSEYLLYTSGGIVRKPLLSAGKKLVHIHPGYLPEVRGSHGVLWSVLTSKKCGATAFLMNEGIDTGAILLRRHFPPPKFAKIQAKRSNWRFVARAADLALQYTYDPWMRAQVLSELLDHWPIQEQISPPTQEAGETYYVMHPFLCALSYGKMV